LAPPFTIVSEVNPQFMFRSLGGTWMVLMFFGSLAHEPSRVAHARILARRDLFDRRGGAQFFGVSYDPADRDERGVKNHGGVRYFWDFDQAVSRLYGTVSEGRYSPTAFLIDANLRVAAVEPIVRIDALLDRLQMLLDGPSEERPAPVLTVPRVLEPAFCRELVDYYEQRGGQASGFMRQVGDKTVPMLDDAMKKRRDVQIADQTLQNGLRVRLVRRLLPMIEEAFVWRATRIERYIVACYSAEDGGFFRRHRDNTTRGTAHRRFAVTINLNDDYDGGDLRFPEFGLGAHRPPLGGATVFSCSLLHEATPVTRGVRYATLPFLYDEAGAEIRKANAGAVVRHEETDLGADRPQGVSGDASRTPPG
jgi:predicted 2-oxoglutarate/Fe(II)-dependent dioxygenase YbiX/peroxiredoxin